MFTRKDLVFPMPKKNHKGYLKEVLNCGSLFLERLRREPDPFVVVNEIYTSRIKEGAPPAEIEGMAQVVRNIERLNFLQRIQYVKTAPLYFTAPPTETEEINETLFFYADGMVEKVDIEGFLTKGKGSSPFGRKLTDVVVGRHVTAIDYKAFFGCKNLASIIIPNSVLQIGVCAFNGCKSLTSITIPDGITEINSSAFSNCEMLVSVTIPDSVKVIGIHSFFGCKSLVSIDIPKGVREIGAYAFSDCASLASANISSNVSKIGDNAFCNCPHIYYTGSATGAPWGALAIN